MKSFILLALFASIAASSPLPDVPPAIAVEAPETTFVEEAQFATEESFAQAKALVADKGDGACADLADATINEVKQSIDAAKASLDSAQEAKTDADKALADAKGAKINFGDFAFDSLTPGNCDSMFSSSAYTSQKAAVDAATEAASQAAGKVTQAQTAVSDAEGAAKEAVKVCQCNAYKAHEAALEAANTKAQAANKAAWTKGYHLKCVLAGTAPNECTVPPMPKVQAVQLADGVSEDSCGNTGDICPDDQHSVSFPVQTGHGAAAKNSVGDKQMSIEGSCEKGWTFTPSMSGTTPGAWYRGAFAPIKLLQSDLPFTLSWTASIQGSGDVEGNHAYQFFGLDYLPNNEQATWYDCQLDFAMRCDYKNDNQQNTAKVTEYQQGCKTDNTQYVNDCTCGSGGKMEMKA